jgi:HEPN domain-containing protein
VEKSLKAWLAILGVEYPLTHSLIDLLHLLQQKEMQVEAFWNLAALQDFAVRFRYELSSSQEELMDRSAWIGDVKALYCYVKQLLDEETSSG